MKKKFLLVLIALSFFANAKEKAPVSITTHSYQKVVTTSKSGKKIIKWQSVKKAVPGDIIKYVNSVKNSSPSEIKNVVVRNKINPNLIYIPKSAKAQSKATIKFSVDGGKTFKLAKNLYVVKNGKKRVATYKDYNAIEWSIDSVGSKKTVNVEFKAKIK